MEQFLDIQPGSVSIMGLMNDHDHRVRLLVDREIYEADYVGCHPCKNTSSLLISHSDLFDVFVKAVGHMPTVVDL